MIIDDAIPEGYQRTVVGVYPNDWNPELLGYLCYFITKGATPTTYGFNWQDDGVLFLRSECVSEQGLDLNQSMFITSTAHNFLKRSEVRAGDILITITGNVGRVVYLSKDFGFANINQHIARIRINNNNTDSEFVFHFLSQETLRKYFISITTGQAYPQISLKQVRDTIIPLPSLPEQKHIAKTLSHIDALIAILNNLIAKKRNIKQGTMQKLLTGKKRLPLFAGEWEELNIFKSSILKARIGWQGLTTKEYLNHGNYYLVTGTDFIDGKVKWESCCYVEKVRYEQDKNIQLKNDDVLITKDGTIGKVAYIEDLPGPATLNSGVFVIRPKNNGYSSLYFYYILKSVLFDDFLRRLQAGSTISHLYQKDFINFNFPVPPTIEEQRAIAKILRDMDSEIESFVHKRDKYKAIKQGMMQELLTGKTRLV